MAPRKMTAAQNRMIHATAARGGLDNEDIHTVVYGLTGKESLTELTRALRAYEPGDKAQIRVYRGGQEMIFLLTLDERPRETQTAEPQSGAESQMPEGNYEDWFDYFSPFFGYGNGNCG